MAFVIFNNKTNSFVGHMNGKRTWEKMLKDAHHFSTKLKADNYLSKNFKSDYKETPIYDVEILDTKDLMDGLYTPWKHTPESAAASLDSLSSLVNDTMQLYDKYASLLQYFGNAVSVCDHETLDLLHKVELSDEDAENSIKTYKQIRDVRIRRRAAKDSLELATLMLSTGFLTSLKNLKFEMDSWNAYKENRTYHPRVLYGMFDDPA